MIGAGGECQKFISKLCRHACVIQRQTPDIIVKIIKLLRNVSQQVL